MTTATAYSSVNMDTATIWYGNVTIANATQMQVSSGGYVQNYYGNFSYDIYGDIAGGTITSTNYYEFGNKIYEISGGSYSVLTINSYLEQGGLMYNLFSYVFSGNDTLNGSPSSDLIEGFAGNDTINGGAGNDTLKASTGNDKINSSAGNDLLIGGTGQDNLTGGLGADKFKFNAVTETGITATTRDTITDFKHAQADKIDLSAIDAKTGLAANQAFSFIGTAAFSANAAGQLRFDATTHIVYGSNDADTAPEFSILLTGVTSLAATDFVL